MRRCSWRVKQRPGQALVEYVAAVALVAIGLVVVLLAFRGRTGNVMAGTGCRVAAAGSGSLSACDAPGADAGTPGDEGSPGDGGNGNSGHDSGHGWGEHPPDPGPPPGTPGQGNDPPGHGGSPPGKGKPPH